MTVNNPHAHKAAPAHAHGAKQSMVPDSKPAVPKELKLPVQVISQSDVSRLCREIEDINDFFTQSAIKGATTKNVPQVTLSMNSMINDNGLNILQEEDRETLKQFLDMLRTKAPVVHTSFATDPKPDFLMKLAAWFRAEAHLYVLLRVGLQPNIAAGCIVRTTNKYFDFSFRNQFEKSKAKLGEALKKVGA